MAFKVVKSILKLPIIKLQLNYFLTWSQFKLDFITLIKPEV